MSVSNDFLPFATGGGANVESQGAYASDTLRTNGNQPGVAVSALNNKAIRQGSFVASGVAQFVANITGAATVDNGVAAQFLSQLQAAVQAFAPIVTKLSGTGTFNVTYIFFIASGNASATATYTNNAITFTVGATISAGTVLYASGSGAPLVSGTLTKASGTGDATIAFYAVRAPISLYVEALGGGGGGGAATTNNGASGADTTFGTTLISAGGGAGGTTGFGSGGAGGTSSLGTGPSGTAVPGSSGTTGSSQAGVAGGTGGASAFGGAGGGQYSGAGIAGGATTGGGGGGGSVGGGASGSGGGSGGYVNAVITSLLSTYAYVVGAGGAGGSAGGSAGGNGGSGTIVLQQNYQ